MTGLPEGLREAGLKKAPELIRVESSPNSIDLINATARMDKFSAKINAISHKALALPPSKAEEQAKALLELHRVANTSHDPECAMMKTGSVLVECSCRWSERYTTILLICNKLMP